MRVEISKKYKNILTIALTIAFILTCYFTYREFARDEYKENEKVVLDYTITPKVDTKIFLKENNIYDTPFITDDKFVISDFISYLETRFNMEIKSKTADSIKANVNTSIVFESYFGEKDETLWTKTKELSNKVAKEDKNLTYSSTDNYNVDEYKTFLLNVFKQTELKPKSVLSIVWDIKGEALKGEKKLPINKTYKINVPISDSIFKIEKVNFTETSNNAKVKGKVKVKKDLTLSYVFIILDLIILALNCFVITARVKKEKSQYEKKKEGIFKEYSDRLARLEESLYNQYANIINMKDIIDMVRISDEIRQPIFYYEVDEEDEKKIEYFVFDEGRIYYLADFEKIEDTIKDFIKKNN